ncbi:MAG: hypothetical protein ACLFMM_01635 [Methanohalobium sp.]|uniref:hypothetical protein n=1 Tax=Methanohalobium sp. TaxID=2837493 RepID=UPI00397BA852
MVNRTNILITGLLLLLMFLLPVSMATAQNVTESQEQSEDELYNHIKSNISVYNQHTEMVPGFVKSLVGNEEILVLIEKNNNDTLLIKAVTENAEITQFDKIENESQMNPTVKVTTNEETVHSLMNSDDPIETFKQLREDGKLDIEPVGVTKKAVFWVSERIFNLFG